MVYSQREFTALSRCRKGNTYLYTGFFEGEEENIQTIHVPASLVNRVLMKLELTMEGVGVTAFEVVSTSSLTKKEKRRKGGKSIPVFYPYLV